MNTIYDWNEIKEQLEHDIQVWYVKNPDINREREINKERTINWIIDRMKQGPEPTGTRIRMPDYTFTFGSLWEPIAKAMRMRYPVCAMCGERRTVEIHHIRPRYLKGTECDPCNLIGLCVECHDEVHRRMEKGIDDAVRLSISAAFREGVKND